MNSYYTPYIAIQAEGGRVGLTTCRRCGAAILIGDTGTDEAMPLHEAWHALLSACVERKIDRSAEAESE